ncbi:MAG: hypothetical protein AAGI45_17745, partial [Cyanobacteria bacterium P01_H01_bin.26]
MKRAFLSALTILATVGAISPIVAAAESASFNIQSARLEALDARTKNSVHKLRIEHLNNQTKAIEDIQATRLEALDARTKAISNIQEARLDALDARTKAVENIQSERLNALDARTKNSVHKLRIEHLNS